MLLIFKYKVLKKNSPSSGLNKKSRTSDPKRCKAKNGFRPINTFDGD